MIFDFFLKSGSEMHLDSGQETFPENSSNQAFSQMHHQQVRMFIVNLSVCFLVPV